MESDNRSEFLNILAEASNDQIGAPGAVGENLKASFLKAYSALYGKWPSLAQTKPSSRKRAPRTQGKQRQEEAFLDEPYKQQQTRMWCDSAVANQCRGMAAALPVIKESYHEVNDAARALTLDCLAAKAASDADSTEEEDQWMMLDSKGSQHPWTENGWIIVDGCQCVCLP